MPEAVAGASQVGRPHDAKPDRASWGLSPGARPRTLGTVGGVTVAVLVLASVLWMTGDPSPTNHAAASGSIPAQTYAPSAASALAWAASFQGGGWRVEGASGFAVPSALTPPPVTSSTFALLPGPGSGAACTYTSLVASNATFSIPATPGDLAGGNASYWRVDLINAQDGLASVLELGGDITPLYSATCPGNFSGVIEPFPSDILDSSGAAAAAWGPGVAAFVQQYPGFTALFSLSPGTEGFGNSGPAAWSVNYVDCSGSSGQQPVPDYSVTVDAVSGAMVQSGPSTTECPLSWISG